MADYLKVLSDDTVETIMLDDYRDAGSFYILTSDIGIKYQVSKDHVERWTEFHSHPMKPSPMIASSFFMVDEEVLRRIGSNS